MGGIIFNKTGYEPFFDYLKSYAIVCVLIGHTLGDLDKIGYGLWAGMQVPLFILIQVFHSLKKKSKFSLFKILKRIVLPFLITQGFTILILRLLNANKFNELINNMLYTGGVGPGAYYPYIYIQLAIILPLIGSFISRYSEKMLLIFFVCICVAFDVVCSFIELPEWLYRLLSIRFLFLIFFGYMWVFKGVVINIKTIFLSIVSFILCVYFGYFAPNLEPVFFDTEWRFQRWPCYYYVASLYTFLLYLKYKVLSKYSCVQSLFKIIGSSSYEIFLIQMAIIAIKTNLDYGHSAFEKVTGCILVWTISFVGGIGFNIIYNKIIK